MQLKSPRTYFDENPNGQATTNNDDHFTLMSSDEYRDVMESSMDERLIPRAEHARTSASKRALKDEV